MHELFLTSPIPPTPSGLEDSISVLTGYTHMTPTKIYRQKINLKGYGTSGLPKEFLAGVEREFLQLQALQGAEAKIRAERARERLEAWRKLNGQMGKMEYFLGVEVRVDGRDLEMATTDTSTTNRLGTLRFVDRADKVDTKPIVSRPVIQIENEMGLVEKLQRANYQVISSQLIETWQFFHNGVHFELRKIHVEKPELGSWFLTVRIDVADGNVPDQMNSAKGRLLEVVRELGGFFEFVQISSEVLDPRVR